MMPKLMTKLNRIPRPILVSVLIAIVGTIGIITYAAATPAPIYFRVPAGENIVFLASGNDAANSDLPEPMLDLQKQGITVVYTYTDIRAAASLPDHSVGAIVIDASHLPEVDQAWLQSMYHNAVV